MAKEKTQKQLPLTIPLNKHDGAVEQRLLHMYEQLDSKIPNIREWLYSGFILRELGLSQALMDLERTGALKNKSSIEKKKVLAELLGVEFRDYVNPKQEREENKKTSVPVAETWDEIGQ